MSSSLSKSVGLASFLKGKEEEVMVSQKQGIVSILGSDCERTKSPPPLRRTLSADMSSRKWLSQHGFSPLKKTASSEEFPVSISSSDSEEAEEEEYEDHRESEPPGHFHVWSSIQEDNKKKEMEMPRQFDIWSSIVSQKSQEDPKNLPPPYIHPLVKRSASSLSEKSLEICTESLGSETGTDGFSSYPSSETGDSEEVAEDQQQQEHEQEERVTQKSDMEDLRVAKYNILAAAATKKLPPRSFPPPIPSLSSRDGASLQMRSHRDNGRLVLEVVSLPSQNNFHAQRQDGRLVLAFINNPNEQQQQQQQDGEGEAETFKKEVEEEKSDVEQFEVEIENSGDEIKNEETEEVEEGDGKKERIRRLALEEAQPSRIIDVHRLALMVNKPLVLANRNITTWPRKLNEMVKFEEEELEEELVEAISPLTHSLPSPTEVARMIPSSATTGKAAAFFNAYDHNRKSQPTTLASSFKPITLDLLVPIRGNNNKKLPNPSKNLMENEVQESRGKKEESLALLLKGCKELKRSFWFWQPHCIATS